MEKQNDKNSAPQAAPQVDRDAVRPDDGPVKKHGDALVDGSGSRQGQDSSRSERPKNS